MKKLFVKKQPVFSGWQWTGANEQEMPTRLYTKATKSLAVAMLFVELESGKIVSMSPGDWIIVDENRNMSVLSEEDLALLYEPAPGY